MRAVLALLIVPLVGSLVGCSTLLGIQDPSTGGGSGTDAGSDGGVDGMITSGDHLAFSITADFKLARQQMVRFRVQLVHEDSSMMDVSTSTALVLDTDNHAVAVIGSPNAGAVTINGLTAGTVTLRAQYAGVSSATIKATVTDSDCHPVINEVMTGTTVMTTGAADEFVEIYNPCMGSFDVSTWTLDYRGPATTGATDSTMMTQLVGTLGAGKFQLYAGKNYSGTGAVDGTWNDVNGQLGKDDGAVGLRSGVRDTGTLVDSIAYGSVTAGHPFIQTNASGKIPLGSSAARLPFDGRSYGDGATDFVVGTKLTSDAFNAP